MASLAIKIGQPTAEASEADETARPPPTKTNFPFNDIGVEEEGAREGSEATLNDGSVPSTSMILRHPGE